MEDTALSFEIIQELKLPGTQKIKEGQIVECKKGREFGIMVSDTNSFCARGDVYYFFWKPTEFQLERGTIVTAIWDQDTEYSMMKVLTDKSFSVSNDTPISLYHIHKSSDHSIPNQLLNEGNPIIHLLSDDWLRIYFPIENGKAYYEYSPNKGVTTIYYKLLKLEEYRNPNIEYISKRIKNIQNYLSQFDIKLEAEKFHAGESGHYRCYPGRDDSFFHTKYKCINTEDEYIKGLFPFEQDTYDYSCVGRPEDDYNHIDEYETNKYRKEAISKYSKDLHYAYLIKCFFDEISASQKLIENLELKLNGRLKNNEIDSILKSDNPMDVFFNINKFNYKNMYTEF